MNQIASIIEQAFNDINTLSPLDCPQTIQDAVSHTMNQLNQGTIRVAQPTPQGWQVNEWVKKAILIYFRIHNNNIHYDGISHSFDKVPLKYQQYTQDDFQRDGIRVVPGACVRSGTFLGANTVVMPSFINIGAYVDSGCMIDTWATVGSCAQIGKNVHLSGGAGIGGVLEPLQATPTIIEDDCFIGARSEVAEGVIIEKGSVLAMGTFISQSTKIYNRATGEIHYGRVPAGSVVVPGSLPSKAGDCQLNCAVIVKQVDEKTRKKTGVNALLRESIDA
jgi:2,3,4,5-tetrahydropyridine-2,6-dicarboxylate N-succinyltransferase